MNLHLRAVLEGIKKVPYEDMREFAAAVKRGILDRAELPEVEDLHIDDIALALVNTNEQETNYQD